MVRCANKHRVLSIWARIRVAHFFDSVGVSEGVEGVLGAGVGWAYIGNHGRLAVTGHRILEHSRQHRLSKLDMVLLLV